jgi:TolA-binding protein
VIKSYRSTPLPPLGRSWLTRNTETLSQAIEELKKTTDQLSAYVPSLEAQVKNLNGTIVDLHNELHTRELSLERITTAKDDFQC